MRKTINILPPSDFVKFSPSELFRYFFQIGHWTEDSFSDAFQTFTRGKLVSTVTINKWKNRDIIPTRYSGPLFKFIESLAEPNIAGAWIDAFETVWARHSSGRTHIETSNETAELSDIIAAQHQRWIKERYSQPHAKETLSPHDIYVPLQFISADVSDGHPQNIEDIIDLLNETVGEIEPFDWAFISGGPGSGKSMSALHMANLLCQTDAFPIYIRGSRLSTIDIDIKDPKTSIEDAFSIKSFLKHFRGSSYKTAFLILDGLDEINHGSQTSRQKITQLISELETEQTACKAHGKALNIVAFGRQTHIEFSINQIPANASKHFEILSLDGRIRDQNSRDNSSHGQDLRPLWWEKYLAAKGETNDPSLPDFLTTEYDDFSEFGADPLLTYLICQTALNDFQNTSQSALPHERVNALTYSANKNKIYRTIIDQLARRVQPILNKGLFKSVLQHMALAHWHAGGDGGVSQDAVYQTIQDPDIKVAFKALSLSPLKTHAQSDFFITAFYYRISQDEAKDKQSQIEFTHKTFSEYLTATLITDRFLHLISSIGNADDFADAWQVWEGVSRKGIHSPSLADFCQKEAALRFEKVMPLDWDEALTLIQNQINKGMSTSTASITEQQRSSSLMFFIWSCFNLERQKQTGEYFKPSENVQNFTIRHLKSIQIPNGLNFKTGSMMEPLLRDMTFLTHSLSAHHLTSQDMSQLSFSLGHIENIICDDSSFAMTYWSHVKITNGTFSRTVFQQAIFHQWRNYNIDFSHCFFQGSRFQGAYFSACNFDDTFFSQCHFSDVEFKDSNLENVVFDRCVFTDCTFENLDKTKFRHCTFLDMKTEFEAIPAQNLDNSISPSSLEKLM